MPEDLIADAEELRGYVGEPIQRTLEKELDHLDHHCVDFLARSPIAMLSTSGADGRCDCSPRGGPRGFAHVLDAKHVALPDYKGNRRQDSHVNVMENPHVGLLFLIPGLGETLRINGTAQLSHNPELIDRLEIKGDPPSSPSSSRRTRSTPLREGVHPQRALGFVDMAARDRAALGEPNLPRSPRHPGPDAGPGRARAGGELPDAVVVSLGALLRLPDGSGDPICLGHQIGALGRSDPQPAAPWPIGATLRLRRLLS